MSPWAHFNREEHGMTSDMRRWQVTESEKIKCLGPHWRKLQFLSSCVHLTSRIIIIFFWWRARTCWFIVNTGVLQQPVDRGWLLGQMQFKYWVPQPKLFIFGLKILPTNFSKKDNCWVWLAFLFHLFLVFYYCFTLFLVFNNYNFVDLACSCLTLLS